MVKVTTKVEGLASTDPVVATDGASKLYTDKKVRAEKYWTGASGTQDVTASRSVGTVYTNGAKWRYVSVNYGSGSFLCEVRKDSISAWFSTGSGGASDESNRTGVVPPGYEYRVTGPSTIGSWWETDL